MIWLIGGTSDAVEFVDKFPMSEKIIASVTTDYGASLIKGCQVRVGAMDLEEMKVFARENKIRIIVDMSHPFAEIVSRNAQDTARDMDISYLRYTRPIVCQADFTFESMEEFAEFSRKNQGRYLMTVGSKMIGDLEKVRGNNSFIYRILPMIKSLELCQKYRVSLEDIICMKGPFSLDMNMAFLKEFSVDYMLMKDSGEAGGMEEKLEACRRLGVKSLALARKEEEGTQDIDLLVSRVMELVGD